MQDRKVLLICSTMGHCRHIATVAQVIARSGIASACILNMSNLGVGTAIAGIQEYDFQEYCRCELDECFEEGLHAREESVSKAAFLGRWWRGALWALIRFLVRFMNVVNVPIFMTLFAWEVCSLGIAGVDKSQLWRAAFRNTLQRLIRLLQKATTKGACARLSLAKYLASKIFWGLRDAGRRKNIFDRFVGEIHPDLVILPELNWGYSHAWVVDYCKRNGLQLLVIPYTLAGRQEWWASFLGDPRCEVKGSFRRLVGRLFPEWVMEAGGHRVMLPLQWLISCEVSGWSPAIPWVTNSGPDCVVAVDNNFTLEFYRREGVDISGWEVVGSLAEDSMHRAFSKKAELRAELAELYALSSDDNWVLIALPPDQYISLPPEGCVYQNYTELVRQLLLETSSALGDGWTVIVNLHPRCDRGVAREIREFGGKVIERPIEELLPLVELFVASSSATLRWAIACQVPAINYDVYRYGYRDYRLCTGIAEAQSAQEYQCLLLKFKPDSTGVAAWKLRQRSDLQRYFIFDGESEGRILCKVSALMNKSRKLTD